MQYNTRHKLMRPARHDSLESTQLVQRGASTKAIVLFQVRSSSSRCSWSVDSTSRGAVKSPAGRELSRELRPPANRIWPHHIVSGFRMANYRKKFCPENSGCTLRKVGWFVRVNSFFVSSPRCLTPAAPPPQCLPIRYQNPFGNQAAAARCRHK